MKKGLKLLLMFFLLGESTFSQIADSAVSYNEALELYNQGHYEDVLKSFTQNHRNGNKISEQNWRILVAQTYLELKMVPEANKTLVQLLKSNPNYLPIEGFYQEDFYTLVRNILVRPRFSMGGKVGRAIPTFTINKVYSVYDSTDYAAPYNKANGYCYSIFFQENFNHNFALVLDYSYSKYGYKRDLMRQGVDNFALKYAEVIYSNELGISVKKYLFKNNKLKFIGPVSPIPHRGSGPYITLGGYYTKMRQAQGNIELNFLAKDTAGRYINAKNFKLENFDVKDMRNTKRYGFTAALGSSYTLDRIIISAEAKYLSDFTRITNPDKRTSNDELLTNFYYIDNDVSMTRIDVSVSLAYILGYKVKSRLK